MEGRAQLAGQAVPLPQRRVRLFGWRNMAFFVAMPVLFGTYAASAHRLNDLMTGLPVLAYCLLHACVAWWFVCGVTRGVYEVLRPWRPHQLVVLTLGMLVTLWIYAPVTGLLDQLFIWMMRIEPDAVQVRAALHHSDGHSSGLLPSSLRDYLIWLGVNLMFDRVVGLPRYRYPQRVAAPVSASRTPDTGEDRSVAEPVADAERANEPRAGYLFLRRLEDAPDPDEILALKAEQHYIRIITPERKYMVLYRFGDALDELPDAAGTRVHRSWWVAHDGLAKIFQRGRRMEAELSDGTRVPVSSPYQELVRKIAAEKKLSVRSA